MKKEMITKEMYLPLAEKVMELMLKEYPTNPSAHDFGVMLGALAAVKFGIDETLKDYGHTYSQLEMDDKEQ